MASWYEIGLVEAHRIVPELWYTGDLDETGHQKFGPEGRRFETRAEAIAFARTLNGFGYATTVVTWED